MRLNADGRSLAGNKLSQDKKQIKTTLRRPQPLR
jgi:hypothetical protein